jgi:hypothetical protein
LQLLSSQLNLNLIVVCALVFTGSPPTVPGLNCQRLTQRLTLFSKTPSGSASTMVTSWISPLNRYQDKKNSPHYLTILPSGKVNSSAVLRIIVKIKIIAVS